jgi:sugar-specific transcriptional regulator TrmB
LIEKVIAKPSKFQPIPAKDAISVLLQRRKEQNRRLRKKANKVFRNFKDNIIGTPSLGVSQFILLSKSETGPTGHIDKPGRAMDSAKKSVIGFITFELFMKVQLMDKSIWKKAVKRGVRFKFIISVRSDFPQATVLLVDDDKAFCRTGVSIESPVLWSADPSFVAMIKDYLNMKWKSLEKRP